jgi:uncharacterized protein YkwD
VVPFRRAYLVIYRHLALAALAALCLCACAFAASASGSPTRAPTQASSASSRASHGAPPKRTSGHRRANGRNGKCAKRSSFYELGRAPRTKRGKHHARRRARCGKRHSKHKHGSSQHPVRRKSAARHTASHSSSCTDADLRPTGEDLERARAATLCLINRERTDRGEQPLQADAHLQQAAQEHSEDMSSHDYFEHVGPRGDTPVARMRATGYIFSAHVGYEIGENIGWGTLWLASPRAMVSSWMQSPGHRANILGAHFRDTGIGISPQPLSSLARGQAGATYTQDFGVISGS